jgi:hypothetical protein
MTKKHTTGAAAADARGIGRRRLLAGAAGTTLLAACGGQVEEDVDDVARVRLLNATAAYPSMDLLVGDTRRNTGIGSGAVGAYASLKPGTYTTAVTSAGSASTLASTSRTLAEGKAYTVVAYGALGDVATALLEENASAAASGQAKLMVLNAAPDAGSVDVYLTGATESLDNASPVASGVAGGNAVGYATLNAGTYRLRVTAAGDKNQLRFDAPGLVLSSTQVATLVVTPTVASVLTQALLLTQQGGVSALANTLARVRVVASVAENARVSASVGSTSLMVAGISSVGAYTTVAAGTPAFSLVVNNQPVSTQNVALAAGTDTTLLVWGAVATPQLVQLTDDNRLPASSSTQARLRLVHVANGLDGGLTMTADATPIATDVPAGSASAYASVAGGSTQRVIVSSPLVAAPLYSSDVTLAARGVYTLFVLGDRSTSVGLSTALRKER